MLMHVDVICQARDFPCYRYYVTRYCLPHGNAGTAFLVVSINQSNFYSANIPGVARLSGVSFHDEATDQVEGSFNQVPETRANHLAGGFLLWSVMERDGLRHATLPKTHHMK